MWQALTWTKGHLQYIYTIQDRWWYRMLVKTDYTPHYVYSKHERVLLYIYSCLVQYHMCYIITACMCGYLPAEQLGWEKNNIHLEKKSEHVNICPLKFRSCHGSILWIIQGIYGNMRVDVYLKPDILYRYYLTMRENTRWYHINFQTYHFR